MIPLSAEQLAPLRPWIAAEPLSARRQVAQHVLNTGVGSATVDRWPELRGLLLELDGNFAVLGDATVLDLSSVRGPLAADEACEPTLRAALPSLERRERLLQVLRDPPASCPPRDGVVRPVESAEALAGFGQPWVCASWGGPAGLARSGRAWGGYVAGRLVSVACAFLQADAEEEIGVATAPEARGLGLSTACAEQVCRGILGRGRVATWTTAADNVASLRVAAKLGFGDPRPDVLYTVVA